MPHGAHPGIFADDAAGLRVPVLHHRDILAGAREILVEPADHLAPSGVVQVHVDDAGAVIAFRGKRGYLPVQVGELVGGFRFERAESSALVDARVIEGAREAFVIFNALCVGGDAGSRWRAFRAEENADEGDGERALVDVVVAADGVRAAPSTAGVGLGALVNESARNGARMEPGVARALAMPVLAGHAEKRRVTVDDVLVTWDGAVIPMRSLPVRADEPAQLARGIAVAMTLTTGVHHDPPKPHSPSDAEGVGATHAIIEATPAPPSALAEIVRALFPRGWAVEQAVREEALVVDVAGLPRTAPALLQAGPSRGGAPGRE